MDLEHYIGVYPDGFYIRWALENLESFDNLDLIYYLNIKPLMKIVNGGRSGGVKRLIAREKFRKYQEYKESVAYADFEDFENSDGGFDLIDTDHHCWTVYYDGPGFDVSSELRSCWDVVEALLEEPENRLIVISDIHTGFIYVIKSDHTAKGRYHPNSGYYDIDDVVSFGEHPEYNTHKAYALPPEILEEVHNLEKLYESEVE